MSKTEHTIENLERLIFCYNRRHRCSDCAYENRCYDEVAFSTDCFSDNAIKYIRNHIETILRKETKR